jgi:hypothetical protein
LKNKKTFSFAPYFSMMIIHKNTLISEEIFENNFICDLDACKGECCVAGDSGAPLEEDELGKLDDIYDEVKPYLTPNSQRTIEEQGRYLQDFDGEWVTPLNDGRECAFTVFDERGIAKCGIELAFLDGKIDWPKPLSCHLYPIRIVKLSDHEALNYHKWPVCKTACVLGKKEKVTIHQFLKQPLIRKYGKKWYSGLEQIYKEWRKK